VPKTFNIGLEVEELALGAVLRKLNEMPGIAKLHLDLERGGEGAGRKQLEQHAAATRSGTNYPQEVVKFLMSGPKHIREISAKLGGSRSRAYSATTQLRKQGLAEAGEGPGMHQLTHKARAQLGAIKALPAPAKVSHGPSGRASQGSGNIILRTILNDGAKSPAEVRAHAVEQGMSPKSINGVLDRAKKAGLIKKNGQGYELTAKGQKIEVTT
jgi:DNA-binding IscR family transcriptional regulator